MEIYKNFSRGTTVSMARNMHHLTRVLHRSITVLSCRDTIHLR